MAMALGSVSKAEQGPAPKISRSPHSLSHAAFFFSYPFLFPEFFRSFPSLLFRSKRSVFAVCVQFFCFGFCCCFYLNIFSLWKKYARHRVALKLRSGSPVEKHLDGIVWLMLYVTQNFRFGPQEEGSVNRVSVHTLG